MQAKGHLIRTVLEFCDSDASDKQRLRDQIGKLLDDAEKFSSANYVDKPLAGTGQVLRERDYPMHHIGDEQLCEINSMLPWAALTADLDGRLLGSAWSETKRATQQALIDKRLIAFNEAFPLHGKSVLEVGCFEGIHTIGCLSLGAAVTAVDSRTENILKTIVRLWAYGFQADVRFWNLEQPEVPSIIPVDWDMLHHIGVLYHLTNPAENLALLASRTKKAILLDTHVATKETANESYEVEGQTFAFERKREKAISPFAGMDTHAKWLLADDLVRICQAQGFNDIRKCDLREERNGMRVQIWAFR